MLLQNETLWFLNLVAAILFLVMGIFLLVGFTFNLSVVLELQQAANFDNWKFFILLAGIVALLTSGVFAFGSWKEFQMYREVAAQWWQRRSTSWAWGWSWRGLFVLDQKRSRIK